MGYANEAELVVDGGAAPLSPCVYKYLCMYACASVRVATDARPPNDKTFDINRVCCVVFSQHVFTFKVRNVNVILILLVFVYSIIAITNIDNGIVFKNKRQNVL